MSFHGNVSMDPAPLRHYRARGNPSRPIHRQRTPDTRRFRGEGTSLWPWSLLMSLLAALTFNGCSGQQDCKLVLSLEREEKP